MALYPTNQRNLIKHRAEQPLLFLARDSTLAMPNVPLTVRISGEAPLQKQGSATSAGSRLDLGWTSPTSTAAILPPSLPTSATTPSTPSSARVLGTANRRRCGCTDLLWLIVFLLATAGMAAISHYAITTGSARRLLNPRDSEGNICGSPASMDSGRDLRSMPYVVYFNMSNPASYKRCVAGCPVKRAPSDPDPVVCQYDVAVPPAGVNTTTDARFVSGNCTVTVASTQVLGKCVPDVLLSGTKETLSAATQTVNGKDEVSTTVSAASWVATLVGDINAESFVAILFQQLVTKWWIILITLAAAVLLSYLWMFLLIRISAIIVWITIGLVLSILWAFASYFIYNYVRIKIMKQSLLATGVVSLDASLASETLLLVLAIVCGFAAAAILGIVLVFRQSISIATRIIIEASKSLLGMPRIAWFPPAHFLAIIVTAAYSLCIFSLLSTTGTMEPTTKLVYTVGNQTLPVQHGRVLVSSVAAIFYQVCTVLWFVWFYNFMGAIGRTTVAGAISEWYFTPDKKTLNRLALGSALMRVLVHHLGSMAFGALVVPSVQVLNVIGYAIGTSFYKVRRVNDHERKSVVSEKCTEALTIILRTYNTTAYIVLALHGDAFAPSGFSGLLLKTRHAFRIAVTSSISSFILFLAKITITLLTSVVGYLLLIYAAPDSPGQSFAPTSSISLSTLVPMLVIIAVSAFIVSSIFISVFSTAIETVVTCFCEDVENGCADGKYYMSDSLKKLMGFHHNGGAGDDRAPVSPITGSAASLIKR
ncbi:plasma-membrane choline transporter-domain-containing protein [Entophlyctis helioformis]|nr:plasma-membrane choline transporter-domain-containing protein [Entophlyctis helioformis]